jgi:Zn-dependent protease with chaperone function
MIKEIAHWVSDHTWIMIVISGFITGPFMYFMSDSLKNPERYNHK